MPHTETLTHHYASLSDSFNNAWYFSDTYRRWMAEQIISALDIQESDKVVDLGGGTGFTAELVYQLANLKEHVLCVDPSPEMLEEAKQLDGVTTLLGDDTTFTETQSPYHKLLLKEVVHHFKNRPLLFQKISENFPKEGKLLIITRPQRTEFPFFEDAHLAFKKGQPAPQLIISELQQVGFTIELNIIPFPLEINASRWYQMLKQRFMSHLAEFSDSALEKGIEAVRQQYKGQKQLNFNDNLIFITAEKG